jgi:hypothetical protein
VPVALRVPGLRCSVHQTSYAVMCELLRRVLGDAVESGPGAAGGIGSVACRATAALYAVLMDHPIDRRGRCQSCGRTGALLGRPRRCRVYITAGYWLHQPDNVFLLTHLAGELGLGDPLPPGAGAAPTRSTPTGATPVCDQNDSDLLPRIAVDSCTASAQSPAVSPPPCPRGDSSRRDGWPQDHGGVGVHPDGPWSRRVPPEDPPPFSPGRSLLLTGGGPCQR